MYTGFSLGQQQHDLAWLLPLSCRSLPVTFEPASGRLGPAGSPDCSTSISVSFAATDPGAVVGELAISTAGTKEPLLCPLGASVVQSSYQLVDDETKAPVTEVSECSGQLCGLLVLPLMPSSVSTFLPCLPLWMRASKCNTTTLAEPPCTAPPTCLCCTATRYTLASCSLARVSAAS